MTNVKVIQYSDYEFHHKPTGEKLLYSGRHDSWSWVDPSGNILGLEGEYAVTYRLEAWDLSPLDLRKVMRYFE